MLLLDYLLEHNYFVQHLIDYMEKTSMLLAVGRASHYLLPRDWEEGVGVIGKFKKTVFFLTWPIFVVSLMEEIYIF